jgi:hypothetical protein
MIDELERGALTPTLSRKRERGNYYHSLRERSPRSGG